MNQAAVRRVVAYTGCYRTVMELSCSKNLPPRLKAAGIRHTSPLAAINA
jgi:hypothetical protein